MYESILLAISCNESSSLLKYLPLILFTGIEKRKLGTFSRYSSCFVCYVEMGHSSREGVFVSNRLRQNVSNAFKVTIETILLREQWFLHVGLTLCYEGRETTASDRFLFYGVCTSKWRLHQNAFITSLPLDSQKTLGLWSIQRRGGKVNPACAWHFSVHFFAVIALLWRENAKTKFYFSLWTSIGSLGIQLVWLSQRG